MAIMLGILAASLCGLSSLFMRKSIDSGGNSKGFLVVQQLLSLIVAILLNPVRTGHYNWNNSIAFIGIFAGIIMGMMMFSIGKALEKGPPGLTIAILNSSTVVPAIIMFFIFGVSFGHVYHWWNALGSILVVLGLFWATKETLSTYSNKQIWLVFAASAFLLHALFLVMIEWESMLLRPNLPFTRLLPFNLDSSSAQWFMPMIFLASTTYLTCIYSIKEKRIPRSSEILYGALGGMCNGACTFFLIRAAAIASVWERAMVFPTFAVFLILVCNIWGKLLYRENVHWKANAICLGGLFVGTCDWSQLVSSIL